MSEPKMQCRHVFTDGHRCGAICLRHEDLCYFHHTARRPISNPSARRRRGTTFTLPELEDRASIQLALSEILQRIAANDLDPKRAGHLLYGLQIAATLLPKEDPKAKLQTVSDVTHDEELGPLAPAQQVGADRQPTELERLLEAREKRKSQQATVPIIQAAAEQNSEPKTLNPKLFKKNALRRSHQRTLPRSHPFSVSQPWSVERPAHRPARTVVATTG